MGKPPAAILIVRHGARLDAADKDWHLSSPTPYDPPLSYGGWLQARAVGARIASFLHSWRFPAADLPPSAPPRILLHVSPYLRCLQTAIALSAGISQLSDAHNPADTTHRDRRALLRVDACWGEWLSPNYFDQIAPPPCSERLVAAAKDELVRHDQQTVPEADIDPSRNATGHFPGGWTDRDDAGQEEFLAETGPSPERSPERVPSGHRSILTKLNTNLPTVPDGTYMPPTPSYAISTSEPIPAGYVTHARDACVQIDYQWDSMRDPQRWGDGGELPEEWSAMHDRFYQSLGHLVSWYRAEHEDADADGADSIVILVTHGAGCNALVGALTGEPALVDFSTGSLTIAVRKDVKGELDGVPLSEGRACAPPFNDYTLPLVASTDHLRAGGRPPTSVLSSPASMVSPSYQRHRGTSLPQGAFVIGPTATSGLGWSAAARGSLGRPATAPRVGAFHSSQNSNSMGLWGSLATTGEEDEMLPNFGSPVPDGAVSSKKEDSHQDKAQDSRPTPEPTWSRTLPQRTVSQRGLWGGSPLRKDSGVKRRWTVTERRA